MALWLLAFAYMYSTQRIATTKHSCEYIQRAEFLRRLHYLSPNLHNGVQKCIIKPQGNRYVVYVHALKSQWA